MSDRLFERVEQLAKAIEHIDRRLGALESSIRTLGTSPTAKDTRQTCDCSGCTRKRREADQRRLRVLR